MIGTDSVLATKDSFVVVDKINKPQFVRGYDPKFPTMLLKVMDGKATGMLIETEHFQIIASPNQKFIISTDAYDEAINLTVGQHVLTAEGWEKITAIIKMTTLMPMSGIFTASKTFVANSFILLCDF